MADRLTAPRGAGGGDWVSRLRAGAGYPAVGWTFAIWMTIWYFATNGPLGWLADGLLYRRAAVTWLAGGDPWSISELSDKFHFAGLPPTVVAFVPFALLPEAVAGAVMLAGGIAAAVYVQRRLGLPSWVLVSPPFVVGLYVANPHMITMALLVAGRPWLSALSAAVKVYTVPAMIGDRRWRDVALTVAVYAGSVLLLSDLWALYFSQAGTISGRILVETGGGGFSAYARPMMIPTMVALGLLATFDWRTAGWLAVPALWPGTQVYCATFILPVSLPLFLASSTPIFGAVPFAVIVFAIWRWFHVRQPR